MTFNVWDIGGPASMSTVNQCFFTDKALYVVIWNLALGQEAVTNLQTWLLNIEVSILFTHTSGENLPQLTVVIRTLATITPGRQNNSRQTGDNVSVRNV